MFGKQKQDVNEETLITTARSKNDGIVFYSNKAPIAIDACIENGKINIHIIPSILDSIFEHYGIISDDSKIKREKIFEITVILDVIFILITLFFKSFFITYGAMFFSCFISFDLVRVLSVFYGFDIHHGFTTKDVARFHAAEHMSINAYCKLKRVPTLEEIKKASRFSKKCGSNFILMKLAIYFTFFLKITFSELGPNCIVFFASLTLFLLILELFNKRLIFLQFIVTAKPTDLELECALKGIQELDRINSEIKKNHRIKLGQTIIDSEGTIDEFFEYLSKKFDIDLNETSKEANTGE